MSFRRVLRLTACLAALVAAVILAGGSVARAGEGTSETPLRPGDPGWPVAWTTYSPVKGLDEDAADLKAHGVGLVSRGTGKVEDVKKALEAARRLGLKYHIDIPEITENARLVGDAGLTPVPALMIGGAYRGRAIDRHLFSFAAGKHEIIIEPPVYNKGFAYTRGSGGTGQPKAAEKVAHYYPDMPPPVRAEVVVPLKRFDGQQHLKILPATVTPAPPGARPEVDSVTPDMPESSETSGRKLYRLAFDLTGLDGALLDQVGLAVYWPYQGSEQYWMFQHGATSAWAQSTRDALRVRVRDTLKVWAEANGGTFPLDVVLAARFGDECFYITGHMGPPVVSYPLWEYSDVAIGAFRTHAPGLAYPRTWGFPEIYGPDAYAWWLYTLHEGCAALCGIVRDEVAKTAPGLLVFRNTTRMGVFDLSNDHDGSGQDLLARNLDIVHLDPYPVSAGGYSAAIPRDMSYCAGLARRHRRLLIPWMQAHVYGTLRDPAPDQVDRMADEQYAQGVDAVLWLGYGKGTTFPLKVPASWERAAAFHERLAAAPPAKPRARLAALRPYRTWALSSRWENRIRNPADWMLQQFLEVWAVKHGRPYDVFEVPPAPLPSDRDALETALKAYPYVVTTEPREGAWVLRPESDVVDPATGRTVQQALEEQMNARGWLAEER